MNNLLGKQFFLVGNTTKKFPYELIRHFFFQTYSWCTLHSYAMTHPRFMIWLKRWFCSPPYKSYFTLSASVSFMQQWCFNMKTQSIQSCWLTAVSTSAKARNCTHELIASELLHDFFFFFLLLHGETWPHNRNWQGGKLSLNINCMSQGLSARTVMVFSKHLLCWKSVWCYFRSVTTVQERRTRRSDHH